MTDVRFLARPLASLLERTGGPGLGFPASAGVALPGKRLSFDIEDAYGVTLVGSGGDFLVGWDGGQQIRQKAGTTEIHGPPLYALTVDVQAVSAPVNITVSNSATLPDYLGAQKTLAWANTGVFSIKMPRSVQMPCSLIMNYRITGSATAAGVILGMICPALNDENPKVGLRRLATGVLSGYCANSAGTLAAAQLSTDLPEIWRTAAVTLKSNGSCFLTRRASVESVVTTSGSAATIDADLDFLVLGGTPASASVPLHGGSQIGRVMVTNHLLSESEFSNLSDSGPRPWPQCLDSTANCVEYLDFTGPGDTPWRSKISGRMLVFTTTSGNVGSSANVTLSSLSGSTDNTMRTVNRLQGVASNIKIPLTGASVSAVATAEVGIRRAVAASTIQYVGASGASTSAGDCDSASVGIDFVFVRTPSFSAKGETAATSVNLAPLRYDIGQYRNTAVYSSTVTIVPCVYAVTGATRNVAVRSPLLNGVRPTIIPQPVVVFSHGMLGDYTAFADLMETLNTRGYITVQPNHADGIVFEGNSGSGGDWEKRGSEFKELVTRVSSGEFVSTSAVGQTLIAGGHSFGAITVERIIGVKLSGSASVLQDVISAVQGAFLLAPTFQLPGVVYTSSYNSIACPIINLTGTRDTGSDGGSTADNNYLPRRNAHDNIETQKSILSVLKDGVHNQGNLSSANDSNNTFEYHHRNFTQDMVLAFCDRVANRDSRAATFLDGSYWSRYHPWAFWSYEIRQAGATKYQADLANSQRYAIPSGVTQITMVSQVDFYINFGTADVEAGAPHMYFANTDISGETFNVPPTASYFALRAVQDYGLIAPITFASSSYRTY